MTTAKAEARSSAIAKLGRLDIPAQPIELLGHALQRAAAENA